MKAEAAFENCILCHGGGQFAPFVNASLLGSGIHAQLNNATPGNINFACYACHWDGNPPSIHPVNRTIIKTCENCHGTENSLFGAPIISEHRKEGKNIRADADCLTCHSNSIKENAFYSTAAEGVSHYGTTAGLMAPDIRSNNCMWCHFDQEGNPLWGSPPNPAKTVKGIDHSVFTENTDCYRCHVSGGIVPVNFHSAELNKGGGKDCITCHNIEGVVPISKQVDFSLLNEPDYIHYGINNNAQSGDNARCWACHGDGSGSEADQPVGHPRNFRSPKNCEGNDCHALNQNQEEPMIYSHFKDADRIYNPKRALNENITTQAGCAACHRNSIIVDRGNPDLPTVSHYGSKEKLVDSINCIYCHLDRDNAAKWGKAAEINKNSTTLMEINKYNNKFTAYAGDFVDLGSGYSIKVIEISGKRNSAAIELYKGDNIVDSGLVGAGLYVYEEDRIIDNGSSRIPVIILNITEIFFSDNDSFIQFNGSRIIRLHSENRTTSCYLCHFNGDENRRRFVVIDRKDDDVYYTQLLFNSSDRKEYDQAQALLTLANETAKDIHINIEIPGKKTLNEKEKWSLARNFSITLTEVASDGNSARFSLEIEGNTYSDVVRKKELLEYKQSINYLGYQNKNITLFRANVSEIFQGKTNIAVLKDIVALSPDIKKIKDNSSIYGYNVSWLRENNTFQTGRIPENLHSPLLTKGKDGGANCLLCHKISGMGLHNTLNSKATSSVAPANKACWACHGEGSEPSRHPAGYKRPRECISCHVKAEGLYNATFVGDEKHGSLPGCNICHSVDIHEIIKFNVVPDINSLSISKKEVHAGDTIFINATATAGYEMRIRAAELYVDIPDHIFPMSALDGSFDDKVEKITFELNTSGLKPGTHSIYVRAMERNNKWGRERTLTFEVKDNKISTSAPQMSSYNQRYLWAALIVLLMLFLIAIKKLRS